MTRRLRLRRHVLVWAIVGLVLALTHRLMWEYLWILTPVPVAIWGLVGLVLLVVHGLRRPAPGEPYSRRHDAIALLAGLLSFGPLVFVGSTASQWGRFFAHREEYRRVVSAVQRGDSVQTELHYVVDPGPPVRIAFPWPGGIVDNWCGVVHDPTKEVLLANGLDMGTPEWRAHPVTRLFGGDMTSCRALAEPFHLCCFT